jgi:hypothetical protein
VEGGDEGGQAAGPRDRGRRGGVGDEVGEAGPAQLVGREAGEQLGQLDVQGPGHGHDGEAAGAHPGGQPVRRLAALHEGDHRHRHRPLRVELGRADAEPLAGEALPRPQMAEPVGQRLRCLDPHALERPAGIAREG